MDSSLPLHCTDRRNPRNLTSSNAFIHALDDLLTNSPLTFITGHWYSKAWTWDWKTDWESRLVEQATHATIASPPAAPSKE